MSESIGKIASFALVSLVLAALRCSVSLQATGGTGDETVIGKVVFEAI